jgi:hypothetical protein
MPDDQPFDLLEAAKTALWQLYDEIRAEQPIAPMRDDEPAPRLAAVEHP